MDPNILDVGNLRTIKWGSAPFGEWTFRRFIPVGLLPSLEPLIAQVPDDPDFSHPSLVAISNQVMLRLTTAWSYGPIDEKTLLEEIPILHYNEVAVQMDELLRPFLPGSAEIVQDYLRSLLSEAVSSPSPSSSLTSSMKPVGLSLS